MNKPSPYLFIHVPKTGGTSIIHALNIYDYCCHEPISKYPRYLTKNIFTFAFVRNPFDRILSAYNYLITECGNNGDISFARSHLSKFKNFNEFIREFETSANLQSWLHFQTVFNFIDRHIDFVGRYENIQADFNVVCDRIGLLRLPLEHKNSAIHKHYSTYYDNRSINIVKKIFSRELNEFDYNFENRS
jgi:chondroitin 4-sulfotransferase 11